MLLFFFWNIVNKQLKYVNKFSRIDKTTAPQMHFDFANIALEIHSLRGTAIWNNGFWFGSPCNFHKNGTYLLESCLGFHEQFAFCMWGHPWQPYYYEDHRRLDKRANSSASSWPSRYNEHGASRPDQREWISIVQYALCWKYISFRVISIWLR